MNDKYYIGIEIKSNIKELTEYINFDISNRYDNSYYNWECDFSNYIYKQKYERKYKDWNIYILYNFGLKMYIGNKNLNWEDNNEWEKFIRNKELHKILIKESNILIDDFNSNNSNYICKIPDVSEFSIQELYYKDGFFYVPYEKSINTKSIRLEYIDENDVDWKAF